MQFKSGLGVPALHACYTQRGGSTGAGPVLVGAGLQCAALLVSAPAALADCEYFGGMGEVRSGQHRGGGEDQTWEGKQDDARCYCQFQTSFLVQAAQHFLCLRPFKNRHRSRRSIGTEAASPKHFNITEHSHTLRKFSAQAWCSLDPAVPILASLELWVLEDLGLDCNLN